MISKAQLIESTKSDILINKLEKYLGKLYLKYGGEEQFEKINGEKGHGPRYFSQKGQSIRIDLKGNEPEKIELWYSGSAQPDLEISVLNLDITDDKVIEVIANTVLQPYKKEAYEVGGKIYQYASDAIRKALDMGYKPETIPGELGIPVKDVEKYTILKGLKKATPEKIIDPEVIKAEDKMEEGKEKKPFGTVMKDLEGLAQMIVSGVIRGLLVTGRAGTGKTYTITKILENSGKKEGAGYFLIKGSSSPAGLYQAIYTNKEEGDILVLDDADSAFASQDARNILKAALDSTPVRKVSWNSSTNYDPEMVSEEEKEKLEKRGSYPKYFNYAGSIIIISNKRTQDIDPDGAIQSRSCIIEIQPTDEELMDQMKNILPTIYPEVSLNDKMEVWSWLIKSGNKKNISLRKLVRGIEVKKSGIPEWQNYMVYM